MADDDSSIGARVREMRGSRNQTWLAQEMKAHGHRWHQQTVQRVESGDRAVRLSEASTLADLLGTNLAVLAGQDESAAALTSAELVALREFRKSVADAMAHVEPR